MERAESLDVTAGRSSSSPEIFRDGGPAHELGLWLRALDSFCQVRNHPANPDRPDDVARDWASESRIARRVLLRSIQLAHSLLNPYSPQDDALSELEETTVAGAAVVAPTASLDTDILADAADRSFLKLAEALKDALALCDSLLEKPAVNLHAWASFGKMLTRQLELLEASKVLKRAEHHYSTAKLQDALVALTRRDSVPTALGPDLLIIFTELARLLRRLEFIENALKRDQPLKQTLPLFALVHEVARSLVEFIEGCIARADKLDQTIIDALDVTNYAITMELRKVYTKELVGVSELRQAPPIYARIEIAHGLLKNCFEQSTIGLAQSFDPTLTGSRLFDSLQIKLEQSLALRRDLWLLLQLMQRAEKERDQHPISQLVESLSAFHDGSLHYLMYKDWEACERFIEEVSAARGAIELTPVLHRFGAYLETLFNQVSMRTVLADHAFDYPALENPQH
ncbi:MAG TPA: hypothetical protein VM911_12340 [Pyrinomonadaceae bacterium]|nr:hypothetical protein [Pyrinomonadaceae bacterium]